MSTSECIDNLDIISLENMIFRCYYHFMKKLSVFLLFLLTLPVFAGEFEDAYASGNTVLAYFYSSHCKTCSSFTPTYNQILKTHSDIKGVKINVDNKYGEKLFRKYHGFYIPYLIITNSKSKKTVTVSLSCAANDVCFERVMKDFKS